MDEIDTKVLEEIGITDNESKIYISLLKSGASGAGDISESTGIHRRNVYDAIERLKEKGLVREKTMDNRKLFEAENPNKITEILKKREEKVTSIIPELEKLHADPEKKEQVSIFTGESGIKSILDMQLDGTDDIYVMAENDAIADIFRFAFPEYVKTRVEKNIWLNFIFNSFERKQNIQSAPLTRIRYFPKEHSVPATYVIWNDKTAVLTFTEKTPIIVLYENENITEKFKNYFSMIWQIAIR